LLSFAGLAGGVGVAPHDVIEHAQERNAVAFADFRWSLLGFEQV
jgi:hypothetical protein